MASLAYLLSLVYPTRPSVQPPTTRQPPAPNSRAFNNPSSDHNITVLSDYLAEGGEVRRALRNSPSSTGLADLGRSIERPQRAYVTPKLGQSGHHASSPYTSQKQVYRASSSDSLSHGPPRRGSESSTASSASGSSGHSNNMQSILGGKEVIISHSGWAKFAYSGRFPAVLVALNYGRAVIMKERDGIRGEALLADMMIQKTTEDVISICSVWKEDPQIDVEDIQKLAYFKNFMTLRKLHYGQPDAGFASMLHELKSTNPDRVSIAIITRSPETIACIKVPTSRGDIFAIFDPLAKPEHPSGCGIIINSSIDATAARLRSILAIDGPTIPAFEYDWQTELLGIYSAHIFSAQETPDDPLTTNPILKELGSNLLRLQSSLAETETQNESLKLTKHRLELALEEERRIVESLKLQAVETESALESRIVELLSQKRDLTEQVENHELDTRAHLDRINLLEVERQNLVTMQERAQAEHNQAIRIQSQHIDALEEEIESLKRIGDGSGREHEEKLAVQTAKMKELEEHVQRQDEELKGASRLAETKLAALAATIEGLEQENRRLKKDNEERSREHQKLVSSHSEQLISLEAQQTDVITARDAAQDTVKKQGQKLAGLERELGVMRQELLSITHEKTSLETGNHQVGKALKAAQEEVHRVQSQLDKEAGEWQIERQRLQDEVHHGKDLEQRVKDLELADGRRNVELEEYRRNVESLTDENKRLEAAFALHDQAERTESPAPSKPQTPPLSSQNHVKKKSSVSSILPFRKDASASRASLLNRSSVDKTKTSTEEDSVPPLPTATEKSGILSRFSLKGRRHASSS